MHQLPRGRSMLCTLSGSSSLRRAHGLCLHQFPKRAVLQLHEYWGLATGAPPICFAHILITVVERAGQLGSYAKGRIAGLTYDRICDGVEVLPVSAQ